MGDLLRIGVLGAARISKNALLAPASTNRDVAVTTIAARDPQRAQQYAAKHGIPKVVGTYEELVTDPEIDAVYNPLPNGLHGRWTLAALAAGKHVLCEKPFTANADEARTVAAAADKSGLVVMEAFHNRYHPLAQRMQEIVESGELGKLRLVEASFCFRLPMFSDIRYNFDLAGGALMDAGCYAVHIVRRLGGAGTGGEPEVVSAEAKLRGANIDRAMRAELRFPAGHIGRVQCSMWSSAVFKISARAVGEYGELSVFNPLTGHRLSVTTKAGKRVEHLSKRTTYAYQLDAFAGAVLHAEPVLTPPADSIANMTVIDSIYTAAGLPIRQPVPPRFT
ncbi:Gfo/Idh/MocA family oxidoreductase [Kribbella antibiotica]|uniref:Gfo/Idh/MocA family oxidoreductase n=1 Tax=Kribbella antibiotica TaxID=190195 RepID=A0A4R4YWY4_9ACTN|nr:Gfo/Idh/MocA family oxidoreductase [Kribbella antibiotica]TDD49985.1 Gfo/Idh/MocA family oxidoreductase [Kribbella antibiotica]